MIEIYQLNLDVVRSLSIDNITIHYKPICLLQTPSVHCKSTVCPFQPQQQLSSNITIVTVCTSLSNIVIVTIKKLQ